MSDNQVENIGGPGFWGHSLVGLTALRGNRFASCGYEPGDLASTTVWIDSVDTMGELRIEECSVLDTGISANGEIAVDQPAWSVALLGTSCALRGNRVSYSDVNRLTLDRDHRALVMVGPLYYQGFGLGTAQVEGNWFLGPAPSALVELTQVPINEQLALRFNRAIFSANVCQHIAPVEGGRTVSLIVARSTVQGNQVMATSNIPSFDFGNIGRTVFLGNFTQGGVINWTPFPVQFLDFNQLA